MPWGWPISRIALFLLIQEASFVISADVLGGSITDQSGQTAVAWRTLLCRNIWEEAADNNDFKTVILVACHEQQEVVGYDFGTIPVTSYTDTRRVGLSGDAGNIHRHFCSLLTQSNEHARQVCPAYARFTLNKFVELFRVAIWNQALNCETKVWFRLIVSVKKPPDYNKRSTAFTTEEASRFACIFYDLEITSRGDAIYTLMSVAAFPFDLLSSLLNMVVIKQLLTEESIPVFGFHLGVLICNGLVYFCTLYINNGMNILHQIFHPACYIPGMLMPALKGEGLPLFATLSFNFGEISLTNFFALGSFLQMALAFDRVLAMGFPIWYMGHVSDRYVSRILAYLSLTAFLLFALRYGIVVAFHVRQMQTQLGFNSSIAQLKIEELPALWWDDPMHKLMQGFTWALIIASNSLMTFACFFVAYKVIAHRRAQNRLRQMPAQNQGKSQSAAAFLILGTTVVNSVGLFALAIVSFKSAENYPYRTVLAVCCSCGFYVNCCCCSKYRQKLVDVLLLPRLRKIFKALFQNKVDVSHQAVCKPDLRATARL